MQQRLVGEEVWGRMARQVRLIQGARPKATRISRIGEGDAVEPVASGVAQAPVLQPESIASSPERIIHKVATGRAPTSDRSQPPRHSRPIYVGRKRICQKWSYKPNFSA